MKKVRIKVIEYYSGKKEFVCEYNAFDWIKFTILCCIIFGIPHAIYFAIAGDWNTIEKRFKGLISISVEQENIQYRPAIFDNEQDAKLFITQWLEQMDNAEKEYKSKQIKRTKFLKHE